MIPDELLAKLARNTKVDYCAKVLKGERLFYLLVYALLCADRLSQRKLEAVFASQHFKSLFNFSVDMKVTRSSISTRLSTVNLDFFEQAYGLLYERFSSLYTEKEIRDMYLVRIDSSMVAETCNKLKAGFTVGRKAEGRDDRRQIKYTMAYDGFAAKLAEVLSEPVYLSEDKAMPKVLEGLIKKDKNHQNLYVFDRGLMALDNYKKVSLADAAFVGRINTNRKMKVVRSLMTEDTDRDLGKLELTDDVIVHLYNQKHEEDRAGGVLHNQCHQRARPTAAHAARDSRDIQEEVGHRGVLPFPETGTLLLAFPLHKRQRHQGHTLHDAHHGHAHHDIQKAERHRIL